MYVRVPQLSSLRPRVLPPRWSKEKVDLFLRGRSNSRVPILAVFVFFQLSPPSGPRHSIQSLEGSPSSQLDATPKAARDHYFYFFALWSFQKSFSPLKGRPEMTLTQFRGLFTRHSTSSRRSPPLQIFLLRGIPPQSTPFPAASPGRLPPPSYPCQNGPGTEISPPTPFSNLPPIVSPHF